MRHLIIDHLPQETMLILGCMARSLTVEARHKITMFKFILLLENYVIEKVYESSN